MKQIQLGEFTGLCHVKSKTTGLSLAKKHGYRVIKRDNKLFVEVPDDFGGQPETLSDDERWKKARADKAELELAERRGEIAKNNLSTFFSAFAYAVPFYKERLMECTSLSEEDQRRLTEGIERMKEEMRAYIRRELTGEQTDKEPEE